MTSPGRDRFTSSRRTRQSSDQARALKSPDGIGVVQPEAEFCAVIGKRAKLIGDDVENYIFGYTMLNDVTAAGLSLMEVAHLGVPMVGGRKERFTFRPMARYKGMDTFAPIGPHIVPTWSHDDPP